MPISIDRPHAESASLAEFVELFRDADPPAKDHEALAEQARLLTRLYENRQFIGDWLLNDLVNRCASQAGNLYSAQSMVMARLTPNFFLRVNFWPSADDEVVKKTGNGLFSYQLPHDHNFNFLTVGYWGPGYKSDYFEYDFDSVAGYPGEDVETTFVETRNLAQGELMLYRAHKDIHTQHAPTEMSITINVMDQSPVLASQYIFDKDAQKIDKVVDNRSIPQFLNIAASMLGENALERLLHISQSHDDPAVRFHAMRAATRAKPDMTDPLGLFTRALNTNDPTLRGWINAYLAMLERQAQKAPA